MKLSLLSKKCFGNAELLIKNHSNTRVPITEQQEVGDDLSVCVLNILPKTNNLPSLLPINLVKVKI